MLTADYAILVIEPECLRDEKPRRQRISAHLAAECRIQQLPAHNVPVPLSSHARMPMRELRPIPQEMQQPAHRQALPGRRSEEHTSELQSLMRISYAVFCLKKKKN